MCARTTSLPGDGTGSRAPGFGSRGLGALAVISGLALTLALSACDAGTSSPTSTGPNKITLYTCVTDETAQQVIAAFEDAQPGAEVALFRAPTGELNARVAADVRSGGLRADVIWACDPLTMRSLVGQGLVGGWAPKDAAGIPERFRTEDYVGAHVLYLVAINHADVPAPRTWRDLADGGYKVAVPDPAVAASALGALGYFAQAPAYRMRFYQDLERSGATQVSTPDDVTVGVAQGTYSAGMTIATSAYQAKRDGSPVDVSWPRPGAVAVYGPVAVARKSAAMPTAKAFVSFVVSKEGQATVAASGSYPAMQGLPGPAVPDRAPVVYPDWASIAQEQRTLLSDYQKLFGG